LAKGSFSKQQQELAINNPGRPIDLVRLNAERELTKETGQITYVKQIDEVKSGGPRVPVVSRAPKAMDRFHRLIGPKPESRPPENLPVAEG
jgi:hypothetical protein